MVKAKEERTKRKEVRKAMNPEVEEKETKKKGAKETERTKESCQKRNAWKT